MIRFHPVAELTDPLTVTLGLSGASGTGKTFTSLRVARGMARAIGGKGAPIGFVDTENRRALHYKDAFPEMHHHDLRAVGRAGEVGFSPERWIEVIDAAEAAKLPVVVIDSFSHAWEGMGGVLDLQSEILDRLTGGDENKRDKLAQLAWAQIKPRYRRLIDRIVRAEVHIIINTRAKPVMQKGFGDKAVNARNTKTRRIDVPWDPASDGDLMFEMTAMVMLDPKNPGYPVHQIKMADQFKGIFDPNKPMDEETGRLMAEWAQDQRSGAAQKAVMDTAREAARGGKEALRSHWRQISETDRALCRTIVGELERIAGEADARQDDLAGDPFEDLAAGPGPEPSAEDLERAEREAREASRRDEEELARGR
jgi:hypothetical protein